MMRIKVNKKCLMGYEIHHSIHSREAGCVSWDTYWILQRQSNIATGFLDSQLDYAYPVDPVHNIPS